MRLIPPDRRCIISLGYLPYADCYRVNSGSEGAGSSAYRKKPGRCSAATTGSKLARDREVRLRYDPGDVAAACAGEEELRILPAARNFDR